MRHILRKGVIGVSLLHLFTLSLLLFTSCSEENTEEDEFANWQQRNEEMTETWASMAANGQYRKILAYTKEESASGLTSSDYIYVEVLEEGSGTVSPIYTDIMNVAYRGRLIPSKSYSEGYVFDESFLGDFDWRTARFVKLDNSSVVGFLTALMNMHEGDVWRVRIPYQLGYGTTSQSSEIPSYSNLTFDIALKSFEPGE